jgi:hypothetical protein
LIAFDHLGRVLALARLAKLTPASAHQSTRRLDEAAITVA